MNEITIVGYPRSGTTWLTRLLSDLLDSPIQGQGLDRNHCQTGTGGYIIRKTHWQAHEWDGKSKVVFIQRDPRDVAVSAMFYLGLEPTDQNLLNVIWAMVQKEVTFDKEFQIYHRQGIGGDYEGFVRGWLESDAHCIKYGELQKIPLTTLTCATHILLDRCKSPYETELSIDRQRFDLHQASHLHSLRKGIVGDWRNYFKQEHGGFITARLGNFMLEQGYIDSFDWWKEL